MAFFETALYGPAWALFAIEQAAPRGLLRQHRESAPHRREFYARRGGDPAGETVDGTIIVAAPHRLSGRAAGAAGPAGGRRRWRGDTAGLPLIAVDQESGRLATEHLLGLGIG